MDESLLLITNFIIYLRFDGGLTFGLLQNKTYLIHEPFLPGTCIYIQHNGSLVWGTINNIPLPVSPIIQYDASPPSNTSDNIYQSSNIPDSPPYIILLDSVITVKKSYNYLIKSVRDDVSTSWSSENDTSLEGVTQFLHHD